MEFDFKIEGLSELTEQLRSLEKLGKQNNLLKMHCSMPLNLFLMILRPVLHVLKRHITDITVVH